MPLLCLVDDTHVPRNRLVASYSLPSVTRGAARTGQTHTNGIAHTAQCTYKFGGLGASLEQWYQHRIYTQNQKQQKRHQMYSLLFNSMYKPLICYGKALAKRFADCTPAVLSFGFQHVSPTFASTFLTDCSLGPLIC